jgi:hypothetical protein
LVLVRRFSRGPLPSRPADDAAGAGVGRRAAVEDGRPVDQSEKHRRLVEIAHMILTAEEALGPAGAVGGQK